MAKTAVQLYLPDRSLAWTLKTDASKIGMGAVLTQSMPVNKLKISDEQLKQAEEQGLVSADRHIEVPIALVSKKFSEAASRWSTTEQELFALVHAFTKLERLLFASLQSKAHTPA